MKTFYVFLSVFLTATILVVGIGSYIFITENERGGYLSQESLNALNIPPPSIRIVNASNTIYVNGSSDVVVEFSPSMGMVGNSTREYFVMYGLVNPVIIAKQGITIRFVLVNMDDMEHNFVITTRGPPYSYMAMMGVSGMSYGSSIMGSSFLKPYTGNGEYSYENSTFTFNEQGNYWYICTYPGHAQEGMYGQFIVS